MKTINRTIAESIAARVNSGDNSFNAEVEVNSMLVVVEGSYEVECYCEDNYNNGTGAQVITRVQVIINSIYAYNSDGEEIDATFNYQEIEAIAERELAA